uniref:Uncharacterized protein n=1 Tax=Anguilla anguilla TaxID=7936 RepID=A0A0E9TID6_ANGAN
MKLRYQGDGSTLKQEQTTSITLTC